LDEAKKLEEIAINERSLHLEDGGSQFLILWNSQDSFSFFNEACFPYQKFQDIIGKTPRDGEIALKKLKLYYDAYRHKPNTAPIPKCNNCSLELTEAERLMEALFPIQRYRNKIDFGLTKDSFEKFLYETVFAAGCKKISMPSPTVGFFPTPSNTSSTSQLKAKIIEILNTGVPLQIGNICSKRLINNQCTREMGRHAVVINGYKRACKQGKECVELVKVHNSYGDNWQERAANGWLLFDNLLEFTSHRNEYGQHLDALISWIMERPHFITDASKEMQVNSK
jgi:hypothetical protein